MKIEHLYYLSEVFKYKSINKASKHLLLNHQYLGQILNTVESELGAKFITRQRTGIEPTELGKEALPIIEEILGKYNDLQMLIKTSSDHYLYSGKFTILTGPMLNPTDALSAVQELIKQHPNVETIIQELPHKKLLEKVITENNTVGIIVTFNENLFTFQQTYPTLQFIELRTSPIVALVHQNSPLLKTYKTISLRTVLSYDIILYQPLEHNELPTLKILTSANNGKIPQIKYTTSNLHLFYDLMRNEKSITLGIARNAEEDLVAIPLRDKINIKSILAIKKSEANDYLINNFIKLCTNAYR